MKHTNCKRNVCIHVVRVYGSVVQFIHLCVTFLGLRPLIFFLLAVVSTVLQYEIVDKVQETHYSRNLHFIHSLKSGPKYYPRTET